MFEQKEEVLPEEYVFGTDTNQYHLDHHEQFFHEFYPISRLLATLLFFFLIVVTLPVFPPTQLLNKVQVPHLT